MKWNKGLRASYYACYVDAGTWRDLDRIELLSGSISKSDSDLRESAEMEVTDFDQSKEQWVRIYLHSEQTGNREHVPLFTGLATSPSRDIDGFTEEKKIEAYSVLKPAEDILLERGWFAPMLEDGAELIRELLEVTPAPVTVSSGSPKLTTSIVAEDGETNLSMVEKILEVINWRLVIKGDGSILVTKKAPAPAASFELNDNDIVEPQLTVSRDWFDCPNVYRAVSDDDTYTAEDEDGSPLSINGRGRRVMVEELNANVPDNESLQDYAIRKLAEAQMMEETASYKRRFMPDVYVGDIVNFHYEQLNGDYMIKQQKIDLDFAATTSEEVVRYAVD